MVTISSLIVSFVFIILFYIILWRAMKAHESIANSIKIISEKLDLRE
jgi:phage shock protein PspC (stress-responsive transcriptional regulator)